jgi:hypothetical protein
MRDTGLMGIAEKARYCQMEYHQQAKNFLEFAKKIEEKIKKELHKDE